jgi:hypothetical protein
MQPLNKVGSLELISCCRMRLRGSLSHGTARQNEPRNLQDRPSQQDTHPTRQNIRRVTRPVWQSQLAQFEDQNQTAETKQQRQRASGITAPASPWNASRPGPGDESGKRKHAVTDHVLCKIVLVEPPTQHRRHPWDVRNGRRRFPGEVNDPTQEDVKPNSCQSRQHGGVGTEAASLVTAPLGLARTKGSG